MKTVFFVKSKVKRLLAFLEEPRKDDDLHGLAKRMGMEPDKMEEVVYEVLTTFLGGGKAHEKGVTESDVDEAELKAGIKIEMEHINTKSPFARFFAKRISLDHLAESKDWPDPRYYTGNNGLLAWEKTRKSKKEKMKCECGREIQSGRGQGTEDGPQ